jgi:tRNA-dihydrouridine synthase A
MLNPPLVAELALAVSSQTNCPATVKCRIGVDDRDSYEELVAFVRTVSEKGNVGHFIVHARKAVLNANFSPHDNRSIPPLRLVLCSIYSS